MAVKTFTKHILGGSTNGAPIHISNTAIATTVTAAHTAPTGTTGHDEVWLWASNRATDAVRHAHVYFAGIASTHKISAVIPPDDGGVLICPGLAINNGAAVRVTATASEAINIYGYVNRINPT